MYLFKNAQNKWIFGNTIYSECPAGTYRVDPSTDFRKVTIRSLMNDAIMFRDIAIGDFLKADGTSYASFAALKLGYDGFFQSAAAGSATSTTIEQADATKLKVTEASAADIKTALQIMDDWDESDRAKVNPIVGQAGVAANSGNKDAATQRVVVATDDVNVAAIKTAVVNSPIPATGTVALGTSRLIPTASGVQMNRHKITVQLLSANLSGNTTFAPEASADGTNWDVLTQNETDISHTLVDDAPFFRTYEVDKGAYIRWNMAGVTTGDVAYVINN